MDETPDDDDDCGDGLAALDEEVTVNLSSATPIFEVFVVRDAYNDMFSPAMPGWLGRHFHLACPRVILASRLKFYVFLEFRTNNNATSSMLKQ